MKSNNRRLVFGSYRLILLAVGLRLVRSVPLRLLLGRSRLLCWCPLSLLWRRLLLARLRLGRLTQRQADVNTEEVKRFPGGTWTFLTSSSPSPSADSSPLSDGSSSLSDGLSSEPSASADATAFSSSSSSSSSLLESMTMALDLLPVFLGLDGLGLLFFFLVLVVESSPDSFFFDFLFFLTGRRCGGQMRESARLLRKL